MEDNTRPILIEPTIHKELLQMTSNENTSHSKFYKDFFTNIFMNYIRPNYSVIICILIVVCLLYVRYIMITKDIHNDPKPIIQHQMPIYQRPIMKEPAANYFGYRHEPKSDSMNVDADTFRKEMPIVQEYPQHVTQNNNIYNYE